MLPIITGLQQWVAWRIFEWKKEKSIKKFDFINYYMKYDYSTLCVNHV